MPRETKAKMQSRLEGIIGELQQRLHDVYESSRREIDRSRNDPLYWNSGEYTFCTAHKDRYFKVRIMGKTLNLYEIHKDYQSILQQVPNCAPIPYRDAHDL